MRNRAVALLTGGVLVTAVLVAVPVPAYADTTLTPSQAVEQLNAVGGATLAATVAGFTETLTDALLPTPATPTVVRFDPVSQLRLTTWADGSGMPHRQLATPGAQYQDLPRDAATLAAIAYAGRPDATWSYYLSPGNPAYGSRPVMAFLLDGIGAGEPAPGQPTNVVQTASTSTDPDGTRHWDVTTRDSVTSPAWLRSYTVTADAQDHLTAVSVVEGPATEPSRYSTVESLDYARPVLVAPTRSELISTTTLALARDSIHLRNRVGRVVLNVAAGANAYAAARHRRVLPRDIAGFTKYYVQMANRSTALIRWYAITTGSVVHARNPFTRELVSYRVSVRYGKAVVTRMA
jgi:hypothetical protein